MNSGYDIGYSIFLEATILLTLRDYYYYYCHYYYCYDDDNDENIDSSLNHTHTHTHKHTEKSILRLRPRLILTDIREITQNSNTALS